MARIRIFLVLVLALTAGGAFAFGTYRYIQQVPSAGEGIGGQLVASDIGAPPEFSGSGASEPVRISRGRGSRRLLRSQRVGRLPPAPRHGAA